MRPGPSVGFVIFGAGSIGQRHLRNLIALGHRVVAVVDPSRARLEEVQAFAPTDCRFLTDEAQGFEAAADAALISSPTSCHVRQARSALARDWHVFVEKPLSHTLEGTAALVEEAARADRKVLVGCNMRFFPSLQLVKRLLDEGRIGRPLSARAHCGYYLPYWHPEEDYRQSYSSRRELGGGVILDDIHEIDYLGWLLGEVREVCCFAEKLSGLEIDTEDVAEIFLRYASGALAAVHLDYLQRTYRRGSEIVGEDGVIVWDYIHQTVQVFGKEDNEVQTFFESINTDRNTMFVQEMEHFARCILGDAAPEVDAAAGRRALQIALAAQRSARERRIIAVGSDG